MLKNNDSLSKIKHSLIKNYDSLIENNGSVITNNDSLNKNNHSGVIKINYSLTKNNHSVIKLVCSIVYLLLLDSYIGTSMGIPLTCANHPEAHSCPKPCMT